MTRYLDLDGLTLTGNALVYAAALGLEYDSTDIPENFEPGDLLLTSPWALQNWTNLPKWVTLQTTDGGKVEYTDPLTHALKKHNLPLTYRKKAPSERSKNYDQYLIAKAEADGVLEKHAVHITVADPNTPPYSVVTDPSEATRVINSLRGKVYAYDYETTGLDPYKARIVGLALADERQSWYVARAGLGALPEFTDLLKDPSTTPIAHNAKYEYKINATNLGVMPMDVVPAQDTLVKHWLLYCGHQYGRDNGLKSVTRRLLNRNVLEFGDVIPNLKTFEETEEFNSAIEMVQSTEEGLDLVAKYAASGDARNTYDLNVLLDEKLKQANLLQVYKDYELLLTPVLAEIELAGLPIDQARLRAIYIEAVEEERLLEQQLRTLGFSGNLNSGEQIANWFYKDLGLPILATTATGRGKVDQPTLDKLRNHHPAVKIFADYNKVSTIKGTFLHPHIIAGTTHIYHSLNQTSTQTGRLSSSNPNMQNMPLKVRDIIVPPEGEVIWGRDYSQIEPRIAAVASGDPYMLHAYNQPSYLRSDGTPTNDKSEAARNSKGEFEVNIDSDPYIQMGLDMGFDRELLLSKEPATRKTVKGAFLGWLYGAGGPKLVETVAKQDVRITVAQANKVTSSLEEKRPALSRWRQAVIQQAHQAAAAFSMNGRRRLMPMINSRDPAYRSAAEREAVNMVCQGTAADVIKRSMPKVQRLLKQVGGTLRNQVHDELVGSHEERFEHEIGHELDKIMEESTMFPLKVEAAAGPSWYSAKPH